MACGELPAAGVNVGSKIIDGNVGKSGKKVTLPLRPGMFLGRRDR